MYTGTFCCALLGVAVLLVLSDDTYTSKLIFPGDRAGVAPRLPSLPTLLRLQSSAEQHVIDAVLPLLRPCHRQRWWWWQFWSPDEDECTARDTENEERTVQLLTQPQTQPPAERPTSTPEVLAAQALCEQQELSLSRDRHRTLTVWSSEFHIGPVADARAVFESTLFDLRLTSEQSSSPTRVRVRERSLSSHCTLTASCANSTSLRVLTRENGIELGSDPEELRRRFCTEYEHDPEMLSVDAFLCSHPSAMCELFMCFAKPMLVWATTRFELGREEPSRWQQWCSNLRWIAAQPHSSVAANNLYDAVYIYYFTGVKPILLPSLALYVGESVYRWSPSLAHKSFLLAPKRLPGSARFWSLFQRRLEIYRMNYPKTTLSFDSIAQLYPKYSFDDLAAHPAIVCIPYQISLMSFFEWYRMCIPIFVPSVELLVHWHLDYQLLHERTWAQVRTGHPSKGSTLNQHSSVEAHLEDPNDDSSVAALRQWLAMSDFYVWPHVIQFESWDHLFDLLLSTDLVEVSTRMKRTNEEIQRETIKTWQHVLQKMHHVALQ